MFTKDGICGFISYKFMKIRISTHAQIRLIERGIDIDKVKKVISNPDILVPQFEGRFKVSKLLDDRTITVIYTKENNVFVVITAI
jgi:Domain of unknown function (DUF4258)